MQMYEDSAYMTAKAFLQRLHSDLGRSDFHIGFSQAPDNEDEYLEILNYLKRKFNEMKLEQKIGDGSNERPTR